MLHTHHTCHLLEIMGDETEGAVRYEDQSRSGVRHSGIFATVRSNGYKVHDQLSTLPRPKVSNNKYTVCVGALREKWGASHQAK